MQQGLFYDSERKPRNENNNSPLQPVIEMMIGNNFVDGRPFPCKIIDKNIYIAHKCIEVDAVIEIYAIADLPDKIEEPVFK